MQPAENVNADAYIGRQGVMLSMFGGVPIISSERVLQKVENFKESRNRSKRLHKKLMKAWGFQSKQVPGMIEIGGKLYCHPALVEQMISATRKTAL